MDAEAEGSLWIRPMGYRDRLHAQLICIEHLKMAGPLEGTPDAGLVESLADDFYRNVREDGSPKLGEKRKPKRWGSSYIAFHEHAPVGLVQVEARGDLITLKRLLVRPSVRRMRIGSYLVYRTVVLPLASRWSSRTDDETPKLHDAFAFLDPDDRPSNDMLRSLGFKAHAFLRDRDGGEAVAMRLGRKEAQGYVNTLSGGFGEIASHEVFSAFVASTKTLV